MAPPKIGERLLLELTTSETIEGTVEYICRSFIQITNVFCRSTNSHQGDTSLTFYHDEVQHIYRVENTPPVTNGVSGDSDPDDVKSITMHKDYFNLLYNMTQDFIYIDSSGAKLNAAFDVLFNAGSIGVVGLGNLFNQTRSLSLLVMCDFKQIYIFDVFALPLRQMEQFRDIFESEYITKVVYDGGALNYALYHCYQMKMANVFDVQISDSILQGEESSKESSRSLAQCLAHHYNFPLSLLDIGDDNWDKIWEDRPLTKQSKVIASQLVAYLLPLRDRLMEIILKDHIAAVKGKYTKMEQSSPAELVKQLRIS